MKITLTKYIAGGGAMVDLIIIFVIISLLGSGLMLLDKKEDENKVELVETNVYEDEETVVRHYKKRKITH